MALACAVPAVVAVGIGLRRAEVDLDERRVPLLGVTAAFVFAAQMLNFPIAGGTSGHFMGAALAAVLLGPWLACLVLAVVLGVQAFLFADGGITALGANVLNMGVIGALLVGGLMVGRAAAARRRPADAPARERRRRVARGDGGRGRDGLRARALRHRAARHGDDGHARRAHADRRGGGGDHGRRRERGARDPAGPDLGGAHAAPDRGQARVRALRPRRGGRPGHGRGPVRVQPCPTGSSASRSSRASTARARAPHAPIPDYAFPAIDDERLATGLAGFIGTLFVFGLAFGVVTLARRRPVT